MTFTVVVTRPFGLYDGYERLRARVEQIGLACICLPVLRTSRLPTTNSLNEALSGLVRGEYSWLVLLSPAAVWACKEALMEVTQALDLPGRLKIALQGPGTHEAFRAAFGQEAHLTPEIALAEELAESLIKVITLEQVSVPKPVLILQARDGRDVVYPALNAAGIPVRTEVLYATEECMVSPEVVHAISRIPVHNLIFMFMSPSAVKATTRIGAPSWLNAEAALCVGPVTSRSAEECGFVNVIEAAVHTEDGLVAALRGRYPR